MQTELAVACHQVAVGILCVGQVEWVLGDRLRTRVRAWSEPFRETRQLLGKPLPATSRLVDRREHRRDLGYGKHPASRDEIRIELNCLAVGGERFFLAV